MTNSHIWRFISFNYFDDYIDWVVDSIDLVDIIIDSVYYIVNSVDLIAVSVGRLDISINLIDDSIDCSVGSFYKIFAYFNLIVGSACNLPSFLSYWLSCWFCL